MSPRGVAVIIEDQRGRILLLLRGPTAPWMPNKWCLFGGKIERGESIAEAARRETREETDLRVYTVSPVGGYDDFVLVRADAWNGRVKLVDREHIRYAWVPREIAWAWDLIPAQREALKI